MELIKVDLPAQDRLLLLHPTSLDSTLSTRYLKSLDRALVRKRGDPKYISSFFRLLIYRTCLIALYLFRSVCLEKKTLDLMLFRLWLDHKQYFRMQLIMAVALLLVALEKRRMSSAYITWVIGGAQTLALTPLMFFSSNSFSMSLDSTSCPMMKR